MELFNYEIKIKKMKKTKLKTRVEILEQEIADLNEVVNALNIALANNLVQLQKMTILIEKLTNGNI